MPNIQVTFDTSLQNARSESSIVINPNDPTQMVAGSKKFADIRNYYFTLATSFSTDGGRSWSPSADLPRGTWDGVSDPALAWDDLGNVFLVGLAFNNPIQIVGIAVYKSVDGGQTWGQPMLIHSSGGDDKQWAAGDTNPASPFHGRVYAAWDGPGGLCFARTLDHGKSWVGLGNSAPGTVLASASFSPEINVGSDGTVYVVYMDFEAADQINMIVSTDGGESFHPVASPAKDIVSLPNSNLPRVDGWTVFPGATFRLVTVPSACVYGSRVMVAWADFRDEVSRIYYARSEDGGATWITGPRGQPLLQNPPANMQHFHPQIASNPSGVFACAFYEYGPKPTASLIDVIMALSFDDGGSFNSFKVTDQPWDPSIDAPNADGLPHATFIGEYFGLDGNDLGFYPLWTDTRTGIQELWVDIVSAKPHVILFEHVNFHGAHKHVFAEEPNLNASDDNFFNDKTSSIVILGGCWEFFIDAKYKGRLGKPLGPGLYPWVEDPNALGPGSNDIISSLRPVLGAKFFT